MANIFNFLQDIIVKKKGDLLNDVDNEVQFSPYMIQRWLSMFSPNFVPLLNVSSNRLYSVFNKQTWYKLFLVLIPKSRFHKIYYIRKNKEKITDDKKDQNTSIEFLAKQYKLSTREISEYIELFEIDIKDLKKKI